MDSVQHLPNASSVAVPCAKPIRTGLCPEGAYEGDSPAKQSLGFNVLRARMEHDKTLG